MLGSPARRLSRGTATALAALAALAAIPGVALAAEDRSDVVPAGLTASLSTAHFVLYYDPATPSPVSGMSLEQYLSAGAADFEEAYGHDVAGGGLEPNAALKAPLPDADGKTDVYLAAPKTMPTYRGGITFTDRAPSLSAFIMMSPDMSRSAFRPRAGHEFMHVLEDAYTRVVHVAFGPMSEAFAGWGAAWALKDANPMDNNFYGADRNAAHPWTPLDCQSTQCGSGYWQWMFIQDQVQAYGPSFVSGYYERYATGLSAANWTSGGYWLDQEIRAITGGTQTLSTRFASYAGDVWDPTRWSKDSIRLLQDDYGLKPAAYTYAGGSTADTGWHSVSIDHLAARYVHVVNVSSSPAPSRAELQVSWQRPEGMAAPVVPVVRHAGHTSWDNGAALSGTQGTVHIGFDPAQVTDVVVPLVNDSLSADGLQFSYRVQILSPPSSSDAPRVSGTPSVGTKLTARAGTWSGTGSISYTYQWQRCKPGCANVRGATAGTYTPGAADIGARIRVLVRASNAVGSTDATSDRVGPIAPSGAQIRATLSRLLAPTGGGARIGALLRSGGFTFVFAAPSGGTASLSWYQVPRGARVSRASPVLVATGRATFRSAGRRKLTVRLTRQGKRLLGAAGRVTLTAKAAFTPPRQRTTAIIKTFGLKR